MNDIPVAFEESGLYQPAEEVMEFDGTVGEETNTLASGKKALEKSIIQTIMIQNLIMKIAQVETNRMKVILLQVLDY
ncbi:hypothetical protein FTO70_16225 [Methanosarcina sp. KYL-1]|uniref:hypothetical protein n=1 Tax=Methanosarcina sp. KYL-1 TaxID=2602068 RepID=UPI003379607A|nr:hypothetical protein [Methanosarcina sp. KYL-1]